MLPIIGKNKTGYGFLIESEGFISPKDNLNFINEIESKTFKGFNKVPVLYAVMQKYGITNGNGRIYPEAILRREVEKYNKLIQMGASAGEADHPESVTISAQNIALKVNKLWWEGATLMGEILLPVSRAFLEQGIVCCPADLMANHILNGIQLGVSSRGVGSVKNINNKKIVQDDLEVLCWDIVTTPSTTASWLFTNQDATKPHIELTVEENVQVELESTDKISNAMSNFLRKYS